MFRAEGRDAAGVYQVAAITEAKWRHLAAVYDGATGKMRLYINASKIGDTGRRGGHRWRPNGSFHQHSRYSSLSSGLEARGVGWDIRTSPYARQEAPFRIVAPETSSNFPAVHLVHQRHSSTSWGDLHRHSQRHMDIGQHKEV